ncbi:MAG: hypothetical protein ACH254_21815, partial [Candidatus Thiodiazotropha endolucinida]
MDWEYLQTEVALAEVEKRGTLQKVAPPQKEDAKKSIDVPPGEYICRRYARTMFGGATRPILFSSRR